jgi:hypothetical protein
MAKTSMLDRITTSTGSLVSLADEYIAKLNEMVNSVAIFLRDLEHADFTLQGPRQRREPDFYKLKCVVEMAEKILPVTMDLAQAISQQIEHGSNENVARLTIRLKLAELEGSIRAMELLLADQRVQNHYKKSNN